MHPLLKVWYTASQNPGLPPLRTAHGAFPSFWQELETWSGWKDVYSLYIAATEKKTSAPSPTKEADAAAAPRKKKSRWGAKTEGGAANPERGRSRWGAKAPAPAVVTVPGGGTLTLSAQQQDAYVALQRKLQEIQFKMANIAVDAARVDALPKGHADRSVSPPPVYDSYGRKTNNRESRWKERFNNQKQDIMESIFDVDRRLLPGNFVKRKKKGKVFIPVKEHPTYNFIGLVIGPRGKTQRELEAKTGCKIAIRGKGSVKEGARGRRDGKAMEGEDEELHVLITGDTTAQVEHAKKIVGELIVVIDDERNEHKQNQLRELAIMNGTLKEDAICTICGEKGHMHYACPTRFASYKKNNAGIKCAFCGDGSHVTRDCPVARAQGQGGVGGAGAAPAKNLDSEYMNFMNELDGKAPVRPPPAPAGGEGGMGGVGGSRAGDIASVIASIGTEQEYVPVLGRPRPVPPPPQMGGPGLGMGRGRGKATNLPAWMTEGGGAAAAAGVGGGGGGTPAVAGRGRVSNLPAWMTEKKEGGEGAVGGEAGAPPGALPGAPPGAPPGALTGAPPPPPGAVPPPQVPPPQQQQQQYNPYQQQQQQQQYGQQYGHPQQGQYGAYGQPQQGAYGQPQQGGYGAPPAVPAQPPAVEEPGKELSWIEKQQLAIKQKKEQEAMAAQQQQGGQVWNPNAFYGGQGGGATQWW
ncbi:hypothetical protein TrLO_g12603 [Triparma laevis f. longispina]|uniref:Branchpoint-bridging protein n=1 Tax=Triparma laevis f. longispina TaxID=1714387 RepID=A0A9W6Z988_9STRA|nr:hypothetical protein TrLO_g12603 [Triparma laevis f. longispina]